MAEKGQASQACPPVSSSPNRNPPVYTSHPTSNLSHLVSSSCPRSHLCPCLSTAPLRFQGERVTIAHPTRSCGRSRFPFPTTPSRKVLCRFDQSSFVPPYRRETKQNTPRTPRKKKSQLDRITGRPRQTARFHRVPPTPLIRTPQTNTFYPLLFPHAPQTQAGNPPFGQNSPARKQEVHPIAPARASCMVLHHPANSQIGTRANQGDLPTPCEVT